MIVTWRANSLSTQSCRRRRSETRLRWEVKKALVSKANYLRASNKTSKDVPGNKLIWRDLLFHKNILSSQETCNCRSLATCSYFIIHLLVAYQKGLALLTNIAVRVRGGQGQRRNGPQHPQAHRTVTTQRTHIMSLYIT